VCVESTINLFFTSIIPFFNAIYTVLFVIKSKKFSSFRLSFLNLVIGEFEQKYIAKIFHKRIMPKL